MTLDSELVFDEQFGECLYEPKIGLEPIVVLRFIRVGDWLLECMRNRASPGFEEIEADVSLRALNLINAFPCGVIHESMQIGVDPARMFDATIEPDVEDLEETQEPICRAIRVERFSVEGESPAIVTWIALFTSKTRLWSLPLTASMPAPGPSISTSLWIASEPLMSVIVPERPRAKLAPTNARKALRLTRALQCLRGHRKGKSVA
jgi:hypothetical protein